MKRLILAAAIALVFPVASASAAEIQGRVQRIEVNKRVMTLQDGTKLYWTEGVTVTEVQEGAMVKATYEERKGQFVLTNITVVE